MEEQRIIRRRFYGRLAREYNADQQRVADEVSLARPESIGRLHPAAADYARAFTAAGGIDE